MKNCEISLGFSNGENLKLGPFVIIEKDCRVGNNVTIGPFTIVGSGTSIGSGTYIGPHCVIGKNVSIGVNCHFTAYDEIRDNCKVGDNVSMGSRGTLSANMIVEDGVIMKYSFVATDTPILSNGNLKSVGVLGRGSMYGANVTIMPGVSVGEFAEVGACSQVRHNVPPYEVWYGNPAKRKV